jgi:CBS domain-containing protein
MTDSVVSVSPEASLLDTLRLFVEEGIHGAPVVSEEGHLEGVITTMDLMRAQEDEHGTALAGNDYFRELLEFSAPDWPGDLVDFQDRLSQRTVSEVMTKQVLTVPRDASVAEIARCLREHKVHRVWVEDGGRLCGVISALDMMAVIENYASSS